MASLYLLKKEHYPSSFRGTVDYELWVMFVNPPTGLANSPAEPLDQCGSSGIYSSFPCSSESRTNNSDYESHLECQCSQMICIWSRRNYLPFYTVGVGGWGRAVGSLQVIGDLCCAKGVFEAYPWGCYPHLVVPGREERVVARVRTWSPLHMWHSLLAPRCLSLTTVPGSAFAPGHQEVILSGN